MKNLTLALVLAVLMSPIQFSWATPAPIVEYQFNEGTGTSAINTGSLGTGTNGAISGATYSSDTPSSTGYSLQFDGIDDYVRVQDTFDYTDRLTIEAWILPYAVDGQRIIWDDYGHPGVDLFVQNGQLGFGLSTTANPGPGVAVYDGGSISVGQWQHVAMIYDGSQIKLYINGVHTGGVYYTSGSIIDNSGYDAAIGSDNQQTWMLNFYGMIDDFRIYEAALTPKLLTPKLLKGGGVTNEVITR